MVADFNGIRISKNIPSYNFLGGDFGKEIIDEYNSIVKQDYKNNPELRFLYFREDDKQARGSNSYSTVLINKILSKQELRTAIPLDIQNIINDNENFLRSTCDFPELGLVLKTDSEDSWNEYLARKLGKQAKERKYEFSDVNPLVFKCNDLELILDDNAPQGLAFNMKESASPFNAPELSTENNYRKFKDTNKYGLPIFDEELQCFDGNRTNWTGDEYMKTGLLRFRLNNISQTFPLSLCSGRASIGGADGNAVIIVVDEKEESRFKEIRRDIKQNLRL
jgi:hypothetical protein